MILTIHDEDILARELESHRVEFFPDVLPPDKE